jgi:hypothetical protein
MIQTRPTILWTIAALCLLVGPVSCLDSSEPERIVRGTITTPDGEPIEGAVVAVGLRHALTGADGSYALTGLPTNAHGPITAAAPGFTAWSLDTSSLTAFSTRLRPRRAPTPSGWISIAIAADVPAASDRTMWVTSDDGRVVEFVMRAGAREAVVELQLTVGRRVVGVFGAPMQGLAAVWAAPVRVSVTTTGRASLVVALAPVQTEFVELELSPPSPQIAVVSVSCNLDGVSLLVGRTAVEPGRSVVGLDLFGVDAGSCEVVASYQVDVGFGPVQHVGFVTDIKQANLGDAVVRMPPDTVLAPVAGEEITWSVAPGATVYDVFVAPDLGDAAGAPVWSATTEATQIRLPALPDESLAAVDQEPGDALVRVVARYVPDLDIEDNWDWTAYHGYVASPWLPISADTLAPLQR